MATHGILEHFEFYVQNVVNLDLAVVAMLIVAQYHWVLRNNRIIVYLNAVQSKFEF